MLLLGGAIQFSGRRTGAADERRPARRAGLGGMASGGVGPGENRLVLGRQNFNRGPWPLGFTAK